MFLCGTSKRKRPVSQKAHSQFLEKHNIISDNLPPGQLNYTQIWMFLFSLETPSCFVKEKFYLWRLQKFFTNMSFFSIMCKHHFLTSTLDDRVASMVSDVINPIALGCFWLFSYGCSVIWSPHPPSWNSWQYNITIYYPSEYDVTRCHVLLISLSHHFF